MTSITSEQEQEQEQKIFSPDDKTTEPAKVVKAPTSLLGFDFGTKSIGVATGQMITATAQPIARSKLMMVFQTGAQ